MGKHMWLKNILLFIGAIVLVYIGVYFFIKKETTLRHNISLEDEFFAYDKEGVLKAIYGVTNRFEIDNMLSYYEWKLYGVDYKYNDISVLLKMPINSIVYPQKYLKDSTVAYVVFKHYHSYKKDTVTMNLYIPTSIMHKSPTIKTKD